MCSSQDARQPRRWQLSYAPVLGVNEGGASALIYQIVPRVLEDPFFPNIQLRVLPAALIIVPDLPVGVLIQSVVIMECMFRPVIPINSDHRFLVPVLFLPERTAAKAVQLVFSLNVPYDWASGP